MNLLEAYKKRLSVSESVYSKTHNGETLDDNKKYVIARVLANTSSYLNEAFANSVGTQRADLGLFKKFALKNKFEAIYSNIYCIKPCEMLENPF